MPVEPEAREDRHAADDDERRACARTAAGSRSGRRRRSAGGRRGSRPARPARRPPRSGAASAGGRGGPQGVSCGASRAVYWCWRRAERTAATTSAACSSVEHRAHRDREVRARELLGGRQLDAGAPLGHRGLAVRGDAVVDLVADARGAQRPPRARRPPRRARRRGATPDRAGGGAGSSTSSPRPARSYAAAPARRPSHQRVEVRQLHAQDRRLQLVEARVVADELERALVLGAVEAQQRGSARRAPRRSS